MTNLKSKNGRKILLLLPIILVFGASVVWPAQSRTLRVQRVVEVVGDWPKEVTLEYRVSLRQDTYLLYLPAPADLLVKNLSADTILFIFPLWDGWRLKDPSGKLLRPKISPDQMPTKMPPGDSLGGHINLRNFGEKDPTGQFPDPVLPVGKYTFDYLAVTTGGKATIGPFAFYVVEPTGEEAEAVKHYLDAFAPIRLQRIRQAKTEAEKDSLFAEEVRRMLDFADRYPKSVYALKALGEVKMNAWNILGDGELAYEINERILKLFPNSYDIGFLYLYYGIHKGGKNDTVSFRAKLDSIVQSAKSPELVRAARQTLKELENKE